MEQYKLNREIQRERKREQDRYGMFKEFIKRRKDLAATEIQFSNYLKFISNVEFPGQGLNFSEGGKVKL